MFTKDKLFIHHKDHVLLGYCVRQGSRIYRSRNWGPQLFFSIINLKFKTILKQEYNSYEDLIIELLPLDGSTTSSRWCSFFVSHERRGRTRSWGRSLWRKTRAGREPEHVLAWVTSWGWSALQLDWKSGTGWQAQGIQQRATLGARRFVHFGLRIEIWHFLNDFLRLFWDEKAFLPCLKIIAQSSII